MFTKGLRQGPSERPHTALPLRKAWSRKVGCRDAGARGSKPSVFSSAKGTNSARAQRAAGGPSAATWIVLRHRKQVPRENSLIAFSLTSPLSS